MLHKIVLNFLIFTSVILSQTLKVNKVEPPNWWSNHTYNTLQLMFYGENLTNAKVESLNDLIKIKNVPHKNEKYLFVNILIDSKAPDDDYFFVIRNSTSSDTVCFNLLERDSSENIHQGFSNDDVVYLIFPDRFANGDTSNDFLFNNKEEFDYWDLNGRHGGDIQGMIDHLDYIKELGATAIWSTPLLENNMYMSYHGYAATDFYKIDPRHGNNELYKTFVKLAHDKGLKVIYDHVANHIGVNHPWVENPPTKTWFHGTVKNHKPADHNKVSLVDDYVDQKNVESVNEGWFVDYMPDLNQSDCFVANYIIQNTIWWIEYAGLDGIREDTYPYVDQQFMAKWAKTILDYYPKLNIVGEVWKGDPAMLAKFQTKSLFNKDFDSHLPVVTDFAFRDVIFDYMGEKSNLRNIYEFFAKDFVYANPNNLLIFFDNHDIDRGMYAANWNLDKFKKGLTLLLTTRGIPQLFYGTEFGLDGGEHHGKIRAPFPIGFDSKYLVDPEKENKQKDIFNFTKNLLTLRAENKILRKGKFVQYPPKNDLYVYKKVLGNETIIVFLNDNIENQKVKLNSFLKINNGTNLHTFDLLEKIIITPNNLNEIEIKNNSITILKVR